MTRITKQPERDLWAAVIMRAVADLNITNRIPYLQLAKKDAEVWLKSEDTGPQSFDWVCRVLDCEAEVVRRAIFKRRGNDAITVLRV